MPGLVTYETVLSNADWQKKKGVIGKRKKTGLGEALTALQAGFAKSAYATVDPAHLGTRTMDPVAYAETVRSFRGSLSAQEKAVAKLILAAKQRTVAAELDFAADKKVKDHVLLIRRRLDELTKFIAPNGPVVTNAVKAADAEYSKHLRSRSQVVKALMPEFAKVSVIHQGLVDDVKQVVAAERAPGADQSTFASFQTRWTSNTNFGRGWTTAVGRWDGLYVKEFPQLTASLHKGPVLRVFLPLDGWLHAAGDEGAGSELASKKAKALIAKVGRQQALTTFVKEISTELKRAEGYVTLSDKLEAELTKHL